MPSPAPRAAAVLARSAEPSAPVRPAVSPWASAPLTRVITSDTGSPDAPERAATPEPMDLDAVADFVLERLRHELRDGRERLGFLLDDSR